MGEHRSLWIAGGPRGEDDFGEVGLGYRRLVERRALTREIGQRLHQVKRQAKGLCALRGLRGDDRGARASPLGDLLREVGHRVDVERHEDGAEP